jgi:hypothetical protein
VSLPGDRPSRGKSRFVGLGNGWPYTGSKQKNRISWRDGARAWNAFEERRASMKHRCYRHPDREGVYHCQKEDIYMCKQCACCHSPDMYCKFRTSCVIQMLTREGELSPCSQVGELKVGQAVD